MERRWVVAPVPISHSIPWFQPARCCESAPQPPLPVVQPGGLILEESEVRVFADGSGKANVRTQARDQYTSSTVTSIGEGASPSAEIPSKGAHLGEGSAAKASSGAASVECGLRQVEQAHVHLCLPAHPRAAAVRVLTERRTVHTAGYRVLLVQ